MLAVVVLVTLLLMLILIVKDDIQRYRIRNSVVLAVIGLFVAYCAASMQWVRLADHALFAGFVLTLTLGLFRLGMMGGGDAKLIVAAELWVGLERSGVFAAILLAATLVYGLGALVGVFPSRRVGGRTIIPFGPCIALAWAATLSLYRTL